MSEVLKIVIGGDTKKFDAALQSIKSKNKALADDLASVGKKATIAFAAFGGAIGLAVNQAAKFETINTQFEILTGSVGEAKRLVEDLSDFTAKTPFQFESVAKAGAQLLGFGFQASEVKSKLQELGDVAAASGKSIDEITLIFGQVAAAGKLTGERLLQFQERAIPIGPAIAKTMGIAETSVKDMVTAGKVDFATFEKAFASLSEKGGFAFEGLIKQSKTTAGVISTLKDNFGLLSADIGKQFLPAVKTAGILLTKLFAVLRENTAITKTVAVLLAMGAALTGMVATVALGTLGFLKLKEALAIARAAIAATTISIRALVGATGIGLLLIVLTDLAVNWERRWQQMRDIFNGFASNIANVGSGLRTLLQGIFTFDKEKAISGFNQVKEAISKSFSDIKENLDVSEQLRKTEEDLAESSLKIEDQKKEMNERELALQREQQEKLQELRDKLYEADFESRLTDNQLKVEQELEHQIEMQELRNEYRNLDLQAAQEIELEKTKTELEERKLRLKDEIKHGKSVARARALFRTEEFKGAEQASNQLIALQQSENSTLKGIGKAAALVRIGIQTAQGAISAYAALAGLPVVGPTLGAAAAAALIAFGGEQAAKVTAANKGGVITGGIAGVDSVPALLTPGELVTPSQNFDEVVNAVANQRLSESGDSSTGDSSGPTEIILSLKDELVDFVEARIIERGRLNIGLGLA